MSKQALRSFNEKGTSRFTSAIIDLQNGIGTIESQVTPLLRNPELTKVVINEDVVEVGEYKTRFDLALHVDKIVGSIKGASFTKLRNNTGLWNWLAAAYLDVIVEEKKDGSRKFGATERYISTTYEANFQAYNRQLIAGAWTILQIHEDSPELVEFLLCSLPHKHSENFEQLSSTNEVITNTNFLRAVRSLYWDVEKEKPKQQTGDRNYGGVRRIPAVYNQLKLTYDFSKMSTEHILELLPSEFDRFK